MRDKLTFSVVATNNLDNSMVVLISKVRYEYVLQTHVDDARVELFNRRRSPFQQLSWIKRDCKEYRKL